MRIDDITTIQACIRKTDCIFEASGQPDTVVEIGEQVSWISCALRSSDVEGTVACFPGVEDAIEIARTETSVSLMVEITASIQSIEPGLFDHGYCWRSLFCRPLLVQGFPIARRPTQMPGLEMPLNVMAGLNSSPRIHKYGGNYYLKGYSTALVPTEKIGNMVLWHFYYSDDGSRLPYPNPTSLRCVDLSMQDLTAARHVVGWCSNANFKTGKLFMK